MGLIRSDLERYGCILDFNVTNGWIRYLYNRMKFTQRMVTTSRPKINQAAWVTQLFLYDIMQTVKKQNIPDELIINVDQTPSIYVPTDNKTMARKGEKHVARKGASDKRGVTVTLSETLNGDILHFQIIYKGKTSTSLPSMKFPKGFCLSYNESHWSNEAETIRLLQEVIKPYAQKIKKELNLPVDAKVLLVWDEFKAQSSEAVKETLADLDIVTVMVPKDMTHLLQPLDLNTNTTFKQNMTHLLQALELTTNTTYYNHWSSLLTRLSNKI